MTDETPVEPQPNHRVAGQDMANPAMQFVVPVHTGHRADAEAYTRSSKKTYQRKIARQRKAKNA